MGMNKLDNTAFALVTLAGLNLGIVGASGFNFVTWLLGTGFLTKFVYIVIGASAIYGLFRIKK